MLSLRATESQDVDEIFEKLEKYEDEDSVYRVVPNFNDGSGLVQTDSYNAIVTEHGAQIKGVDSTDSKFLELSEAEKNAFDYLVDVYNSN